MDIELIKDWIGNKKSTFMQLGASNHTDKEREKNDYYATDPHALKIFLNKLKEDKLELHKDIWGRWPIWSGSTRPTRG